MAGVAGSQPSNLATPTGVPEADPLDAELSKMGGAPHQQAQPAQAPVDQVGAPQGAPQFANGPAIEDPLDAALAQHDAITNSGLSENDLADQSMGDQIGNLGMRAKFGFARSDKEKMQVLEDKFGEGNVKKIESKHGTEFRYKDGDKWKPVDPSGLDIGDIPEMARTAMEQAVALPAEALGTASAGSEAVTGAGAVAVPATLAAGRAAGMAMGMSAADAFANHVLGIQQDPDRNKAVERTVGAGLSALFGGISDKFSAMASRSVATAPSRLAPIEERLADVTKTFDSSVKVLEDAKLIKPVDGMETSYTPQMRDPNNMFMKQEVAKIAQNPKLAPVMQNIDNKITNMGQDMINRFSESVGVKPEAKGAAKYIDLADKADKAEGEAIGAYREAAKQSSTKTGQLSPVDNTQDAVSKVSDHLGMNLSSDAGKLNKMTSQELVDAGKIGINDTKAADTYLLGPNSLLSKLQKTLVENGGKLPFQQIETLRTQASDIAKQVRNDQSIGSGLKKMVFDLEKGLRSDSDTAVGDLISPAAKDAYQASKAKFGALKDAQDTLGNTLERSDIYSSKFGQKIFGNTEKGADSLQAWKTVLADQPSAWENIKYNFMDDMRIKALNNEGKVDMGKWAKQLDNLAPEARKELLGTKGEETFKAMKVFIDRANEGQAVNFASQKELGSSRSLLVKILSSPKHIVDSAADLMGHALKTDEFARYATQEGQEEMLKGIPRAYRTSAKAFLKSVALTTSNRNVAAQDALKNKVAIPAIYEGLKSFGQSAPADLPAEPVQPGN